MSLSFSRCLSLSLSLCFSLSLCLSFSFSFSLSVFFSLSLCLFLSLSLSDLYTPPSSPPPCLTSPCPPLSRLHLLARLLALLDAECCSVLQCVAVGGVPEQCVLCRSLARPHHQHTKETFTHKRDQSTHQRDIFKHKRDLSARTILAPWLTR